MNHKESLNFLKLNVKWLGIGILLLLLGYVVLGWNSASAPSFETRLYAWHKVTLAPFLLLLGYICIGISIMVSSKK